MFGFALEGGTGDAKRGVSVFTTDVSLFMPPALPNEPRPPEKPPDATPGGVSTGRGLSKPTRCEGSSSNGLEDERP